MHINEQSKKGTKMYKPDNWVILKMTTKEYGTYYKVLAGWSGGYLYSDLWRMNSGIKKIEETEYTYKIFGESASVYECGKGSERMSMMTGQIYGQLQSQIEESANSDKMKVEMVGIKSILEEFK